jgi:hypothetical protein
MLKTAVMTPEQLYLELGRLIAEAEAAVLARPVARRGRSL